MRSILLLPLLLLSPAAFASGAAGTFGLHLFFDEREFVDVLTITEPQPGRFQGTMYVPNDFDGTLENVTVAGEDISFDLRVPKNASRPADLRFHYEGRFFGSAHDQLTGFVTLAYHQEFVASFVAFRRGER